MDPHYFEKPDPDPHPDQSEKPDPDPQINEKKSTLAFVRKVHQMFLCEIGKIEMKKGLNTYGIEVEIIHENTLKKSHDTVPTLFLRLLRLGLKGVADPEPFSTRPAFWILNDLKVGSGTSGYRRTQAGPDLWTNYL
jgi:hypothetical protein